MKGLNVSTQTEGVLAGKEERGWPTIEVGLGDIKRERDNIGGGGRS